MDWKLNPIAEKIRLNLGGRYNTHPKPRYEGWIGIDGVYKASTDYRVKHVFPYRMRLPENSVDAILSEHFLEHLIEPHVEKVLRDCYRVLKAGGRMRMAVPDFNHPLYEHMRVSQKDDDKNHKSIWTLDKLSRVIEAAGFDRICPMHFWTHRGDESGAGASYQFTERILDESHGIIKRTPKHDRRNKKNRQWGRLHKTSLVIDAIKIEGGNA